MKERKTEGKKNSRDWKDVKVTKKKKKKKKKESNK